MAAFISACTPHFAQTATPNTLSTKLLSSTKPVKAGTFYSPDDPNIAYSGRIDFTDPMKPKFSAPGVYIQATFRGSAAVVWLEDEFKWSKYRNYYDVVIDDTSILKLMPQKSVKRYEVASDLPAGEHTIVLFKRTEACIGFTKFLGFEFFGEILPAAPKPDRRIEFIGDSITCGSGNEAVNESPECLKDGWGQPYHNARMSFASIIGRKLDAEYHITAVSGIGLTRNYSFQYDARPLPDVYDLTFFERTGLPHWEHTRFVPHVLVIALGTNDFSPGDSERPLMTVDIFVSAYVEFINKLRGYYPDAVIFCVSSPMLADGWPQPSDKSATHQKQAITQVVEDFNRRGDLNIYKFFATHMMGRGCGTHPDVEQHILLAEELETYIASVMGW